MSGLNIEINFKNILKFVIPSVFMNLILALYTTIDSLFVANYVPNNGIGALNLVMPIINLTIAFSMMLVSGGSALIGKYLGEKKEKKANELLTFILLFGIFLITIISLGLFIFKDNVYQILGVINELYILVDQYYLTIIIFLPFLFLQVYTMFFLIADSKPKLSFYFVLLGGILNIILDYILVAILELGLKGAAIATGISYVVPGVLVIIYFGLKKETLKFSIPKCSFKEFFKILSNGSSEMVSNLSESVMILLYNTILMGLIGIVGINAIGILLQLNFLQLSVFFGYCIGISPVISYKYGEKNIKDLKKLVKYSFMILFAYSVINLILMTLFASNLISLFTQEDNLKKLTEIGLYHFAFSYLLTSVNIFVSTFFTAISKGFISALSAFLRTIVFIGGAIILLPKIFGVEGVWLSPIIGEVLTLFVNIILLIFVYKKVLLGEK